MLFGIRFRVTHEVGERAECEHDFVQAALDGGRVLNASSLKLMRTATLLPDETVIDYGLGTRLGTLGGHRVLGHRPQQHDAPFRQRHPPILSFDPHLNPCPHVSGSLAPAALAAFTGSHLENG